MDASHIRSVPALRASHPFEIADELAAIFEQSAVARDVRGGTPKLERDLLRQSGLLNLLIPREFGGLEAGWPVTLEVVRRIARADGSLAHVLGFQQLLLATVRLFGTAEQYRVLSSQTVTGSWFWGNALNPLDRRTSLVWRGDTCILHGDKSFCSGALDSDALVVSAIEEDSQKLVIAVLPSQRHGIELHDDWDCMGQRQTDSGSAHFESVRVDSSELLASPGPLGSTFATLRPCIAQLVLANVYLGIAEGALNAARAYTTGQAHAWFAAGVDRASEDPYLIRGYGELYTELAGASALTDAAAIKLHFAWERGDALTLTERGETAIAIALAKVATSRAGLETATRMFELMGARATQAKARLDRFWRNLRTHTLHDPIDYKLRDIGAYALSQRLPQPTFYS